MKRRLPLSPPQSAAFAMGRVLLLIDTWWKRFHLPIEVERAILIDFAVQHPRAITTVLPSIAPVMRAHGLEKTDLADLFAQRHFMTRRGTFLVVAADLVARGLLDESREKDSTRLQPTEAGQATASRFSGQLSLAIRALSSVICEAWYRKNPVELGVSLESSLPDQSRATSDLLIPFATWLGESDDARTP